MKSNHFFFVGFPCVKYFLIDNPILTILSTKEYLERVLCWQMNIARILNRILNCMILKAYKFAVRMVLDLIKKNCILESLIVSFIFIS